MSDPDNGSSHNSRAKAGTGTPQAPDFAAVGIVAPGDTAAYLSVLLHACPDGIALFDSQLRFVCLNEHMAAMNQRPAREHLGRTLGEISNALEEHVGPRLRAVLANGQALRDVEIVATRIDNGAIGHWLASYLPVYGSGGALLGVCAYARDISAAHAAAGALLTNQETLEQALLENTRLLIEAQDHSARAEEALAQAEAAIRSKDEFLSVVSHELRTPLTSMRGWLHLLRSGRLESGDYEQALEALERSGRAQSQLIEDLLDVSRIVLGKLKLHLQSLDPAHAAQMAIESVQPAARAHAIAIELHSAAFIGRVRVDPERLHQVLWNLLTNAIKFTPDGGRVDVSIERDNHEAIIQVRDSGCGIEAEFLPHVFERFRQADGSTTRPHPGLGLGLAIVRHVTQLHGGTVAVASEGAGRGATFTVRLPLLAEEPAAPTPVVPARHNAGELQGLRVLVVEDEDATLDLLVFALSRYGAQVCPTANAAAGLTQLHLWRPDVIVADIDMAGESGYQFIEQVRALSVCEGGATPALALTAHGSNQDRVRILDSGFEAWLAKPMDLPVLATALAELAKQR